MAFELGARGIRVNAIAPGTVDTAMRRKTIENLPEAVQQELLRMSSAAIRSVGSAALLTSAASPSIWPGDEAAWTSGGIFAIDGSYTAG